MLQADFSMFGDIQSNMPPIPPPVDLVETPFENSKYEMVGYMLDLKKADLSIQNVANVISQHKEVYDQFLGKQSSSSLKTANRLSDPIPTNIEEKTHYKTWSQLSLKEKKGVLFRRAPPVNVKIEPSTLVTSEIKDHVWKKCYHYAKIIPNNYKIKITQRQQTGRYDFFFTDEKTKKMFRSEKSIIEHLTKNPELEPNTEAGIPNFNECVADASVTEPKETEPISSVTLADISVSLPERRGTGTEKHLKHTLEKNCKKDRRGRCVCWLDLSIVKELAVALNSQQYPQIQSGDNTVVISQQGNIPQLGQHCSVLLKPYNGGNVILFVNHNANFMWWFPLNSGFTIETSSELFATLDFPYEGHSYHSNIFYDCGLPMDIENTHFTTVALFAIAHVTQAEDVSQVVNDLISTLELMPTETKISLECSPNIITEYVNLDEGCLDVVDTNPIDMVFDTNESIQLAEDIDFDKITQVSSDEDSVRPTEKKESDDKIWEEYIAQVDKNPRTKNEFFCQIGKRLGWKTNDIESLKLRLDEGSKSWQATHTNVDSSSLLENDSVSESTSSHSSSDEEYNIDGYRYILAKDESDFIEVKTSSITGAGRGGFAKQFIAKDTILAEVVVPNGKKTTFQNSYPDDSDYLFIMDHPSDETLNILFNCAPESENSDPTCLAAMFNDPRDKSACNVKEMNFPNSEEFKERLFLVTTKDINEGEEIYRNYGSLFWTTRESSTLGSKKRSLPNIESESKKPCQ